MSETKINASQTTITAEDIGAAPVYSTMPTAAVGYLDKIVQYVGATDANYTNGYFYECVSDGGNPATYSWTQTDVQPGSSLPSQSGNFGKFLTTDGASASWANALTNKSSASLALAIIGSATQRESVAIGAVASATTEATAIGYSSSAGLESVAVGWRASANGAYSTAVGEEASASGQSSVALGLTAQATAQNAIQIGYGTNSTANTLSVGLGYVNGSQVNVRLLSNDGTIPTDRFTTTPSVDGTYVPTLTISSGVATRTWGAAASAPVVPATAPTLAVNDWSSNTQTITVSGVTSSNVVLVGPAPSSAQDYADAGILCTAQGTDSLTFTCTTVPSNAITLSVVIFG